MLSLFQPQAEELIDFGLAQLITDTNDIRSVINGHSLARDMFGNDATGNALLGVSPTTGLTFSIVSVTQPNPLGQPTLYNLTTNIQSNDSAFFGYNFTRWIMQMSYGGASRVTPTRIPERIRILARGRSRSHSRSSGTRGITQARRMGGCCK